MLDLFRNPVSAPQKSIVQSPQFHRPSEGEQLQETQLSNYQAFIKTNIVRDDDVDTRREFEMHAELHGHTAEFTIPASFTMAQVVGIAQKSISDPFSMLGIGFQNKSRTLAGRNDP
jgi:hypothetical protein